MSVSDIVQEFNALPEGSKEFVSLIFELVTDANGGLDPELLQIVVDGARGYQSARDEILNRTRSDSDASPLTRRCGFANTPRRVALPTMFDKLKPAFITFTGIDERTNLRRIGEPEVVFYDRSLEGVE